MVPDAMGLDELARYLRRDAREVAKLVNRGGVPGRKVAGVWRFTRREINSWIEAQLPNYSDTELRGLEDAHPPEPGEPLVSGLLHEACVAVPLGAGTRASVLKELVNLAEQSWQVYDPEAVLEAVRHREDNGGTAFDGGIALPHPRHPIAGAMGESLIAFARTGRGVPFGGPDGRLTDLFFLVLCTDERTHLRVLTRLARLLLRPGFADTLREADCPADALLAIRTAEQTLLTIDGAA